ncbi:hypothetical protein M3J09_011698 [Ascochyta lentis]
MSYHITTSLQRTYRTARLEFRCCDFSRGCQHAHCSHLLQPIPTRGLNKSGSPTKIFTLNLTF